MLECLNAWDFFHVWIDTHLSVQLKLKPKPDSTKLSSLAMKSLLSASLIIQVISIPDPYMKWTKQNADLHLHLNVPDLDPVEHVHLNNLPPAGGRGNRVGMKNRAGYIQYYFI